MQAVLLAAGNSSRFYPFNLKHKCLIRIAGEEIIIHTIRAVKRAGISSLIIVCSNQKDFEEVLGKGKKFGVKIRYVIQKTPKGMGDALLRASNFLDSDFFLLNSNHMEFDELIGAVNEKRTKNDVVMLAQKSSGKHFGVIKIEGDRVLEVIEKPEVRIAGFRVIGVYFLNREFISILKKVKSEHYSLERALDYFAKKGHVKVAITNQTVLSLKYPWDLLDLKNYILEKQNRSISKKASIAKSAQIEGNVVVEEGAQIMENAVIKGPAYIGRDVYVGSNALIRNGCDIEQAATVGAYMEIKNSLLGEFSKTHSGFLGDSVVGKNVRIGALFGSANVRLDRESIKTVVRGEKVDTGQRSLGTFIGDNTVLGERVSTMPGVIIGSNSVVGPSTTVMKNVDSNVSYYTKFDEFITKNKSAR